MSAAEALAATAAMFAALGDPTRLAMVGMLADGGERSITVLADASDLTRQAVTKHLRQLETTGLVRSRRVGRESLYALRPDTVSAARLYLERIGAHWDDALARLKAHVET